jgi:membrane protein
MASLKERASARLKRLRAEYPVLEHVLLTLGHYGSVNGSAQAGAVTYFGFLSFFPILALAFFFVGIVANVYPDARADMTTAISSFLPHVVGSGKDEIQLSTFEQHAGTVGIVGLVGLLYAGLGWLSGMRAALEVMFQLPKKEQPNFVVGKARDLLMLVVIGVILLVSVALSSAVSGFSQQILDRIGLGDRVVASVILWILAHGLAVLATTILFVAMFKLLAQAQVPRRALIQGAVLGGVGFEILKAVSIFLIGQTANQPAAQAFGVALILLVWINYFTRIVMYAAAWAYTHPQAVAERAAQPVR